MRQEELLALWRNSVPGKYVRMFLNKSFRKLERYPVFKPDFEYKHARAINSRSDLFKVLTGPYFHLMERIVFNLVPFFVKYVPVSQRPRYISDVLRGMVKLLGTDHTAFEAHMTREILFACELQFYRFMLSECEGGMFVFEEIVLALAGTNVCQFRDFTVSVEGVRMSGDMCTSLGNGVTNWFTMACACHDRGIEDLHGVVEGDDGLFGFRDGNVPTEDDLSALGMELKLEVFEHPGQAGFCQMRFDDESLVVVRDPRSILTTFGWSDNCAKLGGEEARKGLLRARALSLLAEAPNSPVVSALGRYGVRATDGVLPRWENTYWEHVLFLGFAPSDVTPWMAERMNKEVPFSSRLVVEDCFGVCPEQQIRIERYLDGLSAIQPLDDPDILEVTSIPQFIHAWDNFVSTVA